MTFRKYLVLAGISFFSTLGDSLLARGMKELGGASLHNLSGLIFAIFNPWVGIGILLLLAFFACYLSALSWADLTYVLPATSIGYVLVALVAHVVFHEQISPTRWLGIALITAGVGYVAGGPSLTPARHRLGLTEHDLSEHDGSKNERPDRLPPHAISEEANL